MKTKKQLPNVILCCVLLVAVLVINIVVFIDNPPEISTIGDLSHTESLYLELLIESVFILGYGILCISFSRFFSAKLTSGFFSVSEVNIGKKLYTSKELILSIVFEAIIALVICSIAYWAFDNYIQIVHVSEPENAGMFIMMPRVIIPMCVIALIALLTFSFYKKDSDISPIDSNGLMYASELKSSSFKHTVWGVSLTTAILSILDMFLFNVSLLAFINNGGSLNLNVLSYFAIIMKTILCFSGLGLIVGGVVHLVVINISGTGKVVVQIFMIAFKALLFVVCAIVCMKTVNIDTDAIVTSFSVIGIGGSLCLKNVIKDITSSVTVVSKNSLKKGDYITGNRPGFVKDFDYSGVWVVSEGSRTFLSYSSLSSVTKISYPYICGKITFAVSSIHSYKNINKMLENSFPKMVESSGSILAAEPIFLDITRSFSYETNYTYLIPTKTENLDKANAYATDYIKRVLDDNNIRSRTINSEDGKALPEETE